MKIGITLKLLIALLLANVVLITIMAVSTQWSFQRGFLDYLRQVEVQELDDLSNALAKDYQQEGSWQFLQDNHRGWHHYYRYLPGHQIEPEEQSHQPERQQRPPPPHFRDTPQGRDQFRDRPLTDRPPPPPGHQGFESRPPPRAPGNPTGLDQRLRLLDIEKRHVIGPPDESGDPILHPITLEGQTIGWLSITPLPWLGEGLESRFYDQQLTALYLSAAGALLLSLLLSVPLGRHFLKPIKKLVQGVHALAAGRFKTRISNKSRDELGRLSQDFNRLAEALERNEKLRRQSMADVSHELRTPLAVLRGEIEALQDGVRSCNEARLESLHNGVLALSRLVDDLYELSLSDVGALNYQKESIDLTNLLKEIEQENSGLFEQQEISLEIKPANRISLFADPKRLHQVFNNLLKNSRRYTDAGGKVLVHCRQNGRSVQIDIQDSAPGIDDASLSRLFERFYRVESSRSRAKGGAGLGLAICKNIIEAHGGSIHAKPSPLGGVWIEIILPIEQ